MTSRRPLTADRVVEAAVAVADRGGLHAVSMRSVGRELGVEAMSLYHHVASKDALLDALAEWIFVRMDAPTPGDAWRAGLERHARSSRQVLRTHPWALAIVESRRSPGPVLLQHHEAVLACLLREAFPVRLAAHAFSVVDAYVHGFVMTERTLPFDADEEAGTAMAAMEAVAFTMPSLAAVAMAWTEDRAAYADQFEWGLALVLDGLAQRLEAARGT